MKNYQRVKAISLVAMGIFVLALLVAAGACDRQKPPDGKEGEASLVGPAFAGEPVIIGVMGPMEGDVGHHGRSLLNAAQFFAQKANAKNGLCGRRVEIISEDDSCGSEKAVEAARRIVKAKPHAILGPVCSTAALAVLDIYQEAEILVISPSATEVHLTRSGLYPLFFRTIAPDDAQAQILANFAVSFLGAESIAVVAGSGVYDTMQAEFVAGYFKAAPHTKMVLLEIFTPEKADWEELAGRIDAVEAQALIFFGHPADSAKMIAAMRDKGLAINFVGDQRIADGAFVREARDYSAGIFACLLPDIMESPLAQKLVREYRDINFAEPSPFYLNAHAALQALFEALERSGCQKGLPLAKALRAIETETPLGNIGFDDMGEVLGHGFAMHQLQNGKFAGLEF